MMRSLVVTCRAPLAFAAAVLLLALAAPPAEAGLTYAGCFTAGTSPATGCTDLSATTTALSAPVGAVVSPDGKHVYTAAVNDAVAHFTRNTTTGAIAFASCVTGSASPTLGCTDLSAQTTSIDYLQDLAMSPDGTSIYVVAHYADAVAHLVRNPATGALSFGGCVSGGAVTGCTSIAGTTNALDEPRGVAVSPDGASVYVTAGAKDAVVRFDRNATSGALAFASCMTSDPGTTGCGTTALGALDVPSPVTVSPDGASVYVGTLTASTLVHFVRAANGALSSATAHTLGALQAVNAVTVSPDGTSLYATSNFGDALVRFTRNPTTGALAFADCLTGGFDPAAGCTDLGEDLPALGSAGNPTVSPDGSTLYASGSNEVLRFTRAASGALTFEECLTSDGPFGPTEGCAETAPTNDALYGVAFVALSPDASTLYAGSFFNDAIGTFATGEGGGTGGGDTGGTPPDDDPTPILTPGDPVPVISSLVARRRSPSGATFRFTLSEAASVRVAILRKTEGRKVRGACRRPTRRNRDARLCARWQPVGAFTAAGRPAGANAIAFKGRLGGRTLPPDDYRAVLVATDAAGNASAAARVGFRLVRR